VGVRFTFYPFDNDSRDVFLVFRSKFDPLLYVMPFHQARPTTGRGGMLGDEYGMSTIRSLFSVLRRLCRTKSLSYELTGMLVQFIETLLLYIRKIFRGKVKFPPESGFFEPLK
jgi:hypothetical protein